MMDEMAAAAPEDGMSRLQDVVLESADIAEVLDELVNLAAATVTVGPKLLCGVTLVRKKFPATVATSAPQVTAMDELQYSFGDGPCLTALRDKVTVYVPDLAEESRWPEYCAVAWSEGINSILSIPLPLDGDAGAALNLYAADRDAFTDAAIARAQSYGRNASKTLRLAVRIAELVSTGENLTAALQSRTVIDLAVGIIMERNRCSQESAMQILRTESNNRNRKLRDIAEAYVASIGKSPRVRTHFDK